MKPCPLCDSTSARRPHDPKTGRCKSEYHCLARRCQRRKERDAAMAQAHTKTTGERRRQCSATMGQRTVLFCELREGHLGLHLHGTREWGGNYTHPVAAAFHALSSRT